MSELVRDAAPAPATPAAPESRGNLSVRAQALQHVVESVALEVPGVVRTEGGLPGVRPSTPRASVRVRGTSARVTVEVACRWPAPVTRIAAEVRDHVLDRASELSGVRLGTVDVTVRIAGIDDRRTS
ncbi:putative alkaline shock family protein YloU [Nocardioides cavernae]|uniref:Putative alkaline shock family protein YloU n=1 Tax=Nocardioides cavernae TaxID=1921566 RepID=A0A7Y9GZ19_9ACTN|nr:Asp23/Gls24 family envelope stress response protein [Nocardioides cavernae]NYE34971.1 putative alkaline shock family protein YloU [Nocardioides cavernae]